jgi:hypothetical protein
MAYDGGAMDPLGTRTRPWDRHYAFDSHDDDDDTNNCRRGVLPPRFHSPGGGKGTTISGYHADAV